MGSNDQGRVSIDPKVIKQDRELQIRNQTITSGISLPKGCRKLISVDVLDKIRAEIKEHADRLKDSLYGDGMRHCIEIIDEYKAESEG